MGKKQVLNKLITICCGPICTEEHDNMKFKNHTASENKQVKRQFMCITKSIVALNILIRKKVMYRAIRSLYNIDLKC